MMRVFLTGATGFIGSRVVAELVNHGHQILGLTRSDAGAAWLEAAGAQAHRGELEDPATLARGAAAADAVIHTAFDHDFSNFVANCEKDRRVIAAMGAALLGSDRPLIITSGTGMGSTGPGRPAVEDAVDWDNPNPRVASERAGAELADQGVSVAVVRLPQVHDTVKQGLISPLVEIARAKGVVGYVGDGANRWPAAHVLDVARLYRLALERHEPGARYNAVAEEGVPVRAIAEAIAAGLGVPTASLSEEEAADYFGWLAPFAALDMPASSAATRERLGWQPQGPSLLHDLERIDYGVAAADA
ncbi:MAG: SDR family oxidoreductase [Sphingomonas sp.]|uniref:SDR family oxidoreductase n=1 Tax=Sphingomonas sp. TaxID=28214 RepID=UPI003F7D556D